MPCHAVSVLQVSLHVARLHPFHPVSRFPSGLPMVLVGFHALGLDLVSRICIQLWLAVPCQEPVAA